ncbi:MAG: hypothetical protein KR126chlam6_00534 [Candidatus Anoxychlamydiales bacterium]|nr:hypothetical protein [Candidatus Anoxychlamydiales bacterium]
MKWLVFLSLFTLVGCHFPSKMVLEGSGGRNAYNIEVQRTNAEEMLLNLVRLRYYDSPFFLEVSSVTSQFTFRNLINAGISIPGFDKTNPMSLGGETLWQNQPTIQYSPLQGQEFANQLMQPMDISIIQHVIYSGWDIDRVFLLTVQNFQDFPNIPRQGLDPDEIVKHEKFHKIVHLMNQLQEKGELQVGVGQEHEKDKEKEHEKKKIQFAFPSDTEQGKGIASLLKIDFAGNGKYIINITVGFDEKGNIGILPRSVLSCMHYLSKGVIVPKIDIEKNKVLDLEKKEFTREEVQKLYQELLTVHNCNKKPKNAYITIKYRDNWFYIKDDDLRSKKTFMLLLELYNLQSGRAPAKGPILTLPIGVG